MPNGRLALVAPNLLDRFDRELGNPAFALSGNAEPVGRNIEVTLSFLRNDGAIQRIGQTHTNDQGGYIDLHLPEGGTIGAPDGRFYVSVGGVGDQTLTRAFVCNVTAQENTDIDFRSEAAMRLILDKVADTPSCKLSDFSPQEICDIVTRIHGLDGSVSGNNAAQINAAATAAAAADPTTQQLLDEACGIFNTPTPRSPTATRIVSTATPTNTFREATFTPTQGEPTEVVDTPTPVNTNTPTVTPTPTLDALQVIVGEGIADEQGKVLVPVTLVTSTSVVGGVQNDILFDNRVVKLDSATKCTINPEIGTNQPGCEEDPIVGPCKTLSRQLSTCGADPQPPGCPAGATSDVSRFRAIIAATAVPNANAIPTDVLYTCEFTVVNAALLPTVLDNNNVVVSDPLGNRLEGAIVTDGLATDGVPRTATPTEPEATLTFTPTNTEGASPTPTSPVIDTPTTPPTVVSPSDTPTTIAITSTPTPTVTASATLTPTLGPPQVDVGMASGTRGSVVQVPVTLSNSAGRVVATANDISYDRTQVRVAMIAGEPDCTIAPDIAPGTSYNKMLVKGTLQDGNTETLRVAVVSFDDPEVVLRDGLLFTCNFLIDNAAESGQMLDNVPSASDANGNDIPAVGSDGAIALQGTLPLVVVEEVTTSSGGTVAVPARLVTGGTMISAAAVDMVYDSQLADVVINEGDSKPACQVDAAIGEGTAADKMTIAEVVPLAGTLKRLRVGVVSFDHPGAAIPTGPLFSCQFKVAAAATGNIGIDASATVADMNGVDSAADAVDSVIHIQ